VDRRCSFNSRWKLVRARSTTEIEMAVASYVNPSEFRRSDWDFTGRSRVTIEVLLGQPERSRNPSERADIVRRLTTYARSFAEEHVDFDFLNAGLKKAGFEPLSHAPTFGPRRPLAEMHPDNRIALNLAERFLGNEVGMAMRDAWCPEAKSRIGELARLVQRATGGTALRPRAGLRPEPMTNVHQDRTDLVVVPDPVLGATVSFEVELGVREKILDPRPEDLEVPVAPHALDPLIDVVIERA
jgi:hypothetical protein